MEYYAYGLNICSRYVTNRFELKGVMNQGFYKVLKNLRSYNISKEFKPWFKTVMIHTCIDHIRKNEKIKQETSLEAAPEPYISSSVIDDMGYEDLIRVVNKLPVAYRTVFNFYVLDGYKHEEIAKKLGIGISTSKSNLSRAKERLRTIIVNSKMTV